MSEEKIELTRRALEILNEVAKNSSGELMVSRFGGKYIINAYIKTIGTGTPEDNADNENAMENLVDNGIMELIATDSYKITKKGYDHLKAKG